MTVRVEPLWRRWVAEDAAQPDFAVLQKRHGELEFVVSQADENHSSGRAHGTDSGPYSGGRTGRVDEGIDLETLDRLGGRLSTRIAPNESTVQPAAREVVSHYVGESFRWMVHDYPSQSARWNYHPEFEVHLIRRSTGSFIIGDQIGPFGPGHVALIGRSELTISAVSEAVGYRNLSNFNRQFCAETGVRPGRIA